MVFQASSPVYGAVLGGRLEYEHAPLFLPARFWLDYMKLEARQRKRERERGRKRERGERKIPSET